MSAEDTVADTQVACPLTKALVELLVCCIQNHTVDTASLASMLFRSEDTVCTQFKHINQRLGTHSRTEAVLYALAHGWVTAPKPEHWLLIKPEHKPNGPKIP